jgi:hypothetical protein
MLYKIRVFELSSFGHEQTYGPFQSFFVYCPKVVDSWKYLADII